VKFKIAIRIPSATHPFVTVTGGRQTGRQVVIGSTWGGAPTDEMLGEFMR